MGSMAEQRGSTAEAIDAYQRAARIRPQEYRLQNKIGYILIGMDEQLAVKTGMGEHVIIFAFLFVLGMIGWLSLRRRPGG